MPYIPRRSIRGQKFSRMNRLPALDNAKGIAIIAVAVFHVLRGFQVAGIVDAGFVWRFADSAAYSFHIQTFFMIAGYLSWPRANAVAFQRDRQFSLYYSYLFWSIISWTIAYALASRVNNAVTVEDLLLIPVRPIEHFWFLPVLMIGTAVLAALRTPLALILGCMVLALVALIDVVHWYGVCECLIFIVLGAWLRAGPGLPPIRSWAAWLGAALLAFGAWIGAASTTAIAPIWLLWSSLGGCYACYAVAHWTTGRPQLSSVLGYLGRHSMPIYLLHILGGSGTRIVLQHIAPHLAAPVAITLSILASFVVPLVIYEGARRLGITRWIGLDPIVMRPARPTSIGLPA